ncbi:MAG: DUF2911 domain-containing protein [Daejeonella sp.]
MKIFTKVIALSLLIASGLSSGVLAQSIKMPPSSPTQTIKQQFALSDISVSYSRPIAKGRQIMGDLVPYGEIWRTGANASTKINFGEDVKIAGTNVPKGEYALYTIPGKEEWTFILSKNTTLWGALGYKQEEDLLRFQAKTSALPNAVESFTIQFANVKPSSLAIELLWEKTSVSFTVNAEIDSRIMKQIETAMGPTDRKPYLEAANYYFESGKDLKQALEWATKATELSSPDQYWVEHLKAKIQLKMGDKKGAIASATSSMNKAKTQKNPDYVVLNEKLIAEAKK